MKTQHTDASRGVTTHVSHRSSHRNRTMKNIIKSLTTFAAVLGLGITLTACNNDAPGKTYERGELKFTVQYPEVCNQATGAPSICNAPITIGVMAEIGDTDKDGVIDPFQAEVTLKRTGLTAVGTLAETPISTDEQAIPLDMTYPAMPEGWKLEHSSGNDAPDPFKFYPITGEEDEDPSMGKVVSLRIVAAGGNIGEDECNDQKPCEGMKVCIANKCTGGNGLGDGCGTDDPCIDGLVCEGNKCVPEPDCTTDADCPMGKICSAMQMCITPACLVDADCKDPNLECADDNTCQPKPDECTTNAQCQNDQVCDDGKCVDSTPECVTNDDCGEKQICNLDTEMCEDVECTKNEHCADNQICDMSLNTCKEIDTADFCTRPLWDTQDPNLDPNAAGNFQFVYGSNEQVKIGKMEIGFKAIMGDETKCLELTQAQKDSMNIDITQGPTHNGQAVCSKPNVNDLTEIKCDGSNLPANTIPTGSFKVTGSFGEGLLNVGVTVDTVDAPWVQEFFLSIFQG